MQEICGLVCAAAANRVQAVVEGFKSKGEKRENVRARCKKVRKNIFALLRHRPAFRAKSKKRKKTDDYGKKEG